jgi:hypothetical protein
MASKGAAAGVCAGDEGAAKTDPPSDGDNGDGDDVGVPNGVGGVAAESNGLDEDGPNGLEDDGPNGLEDPDGPNGPEDEEDPKSNGLAGNVEVLLVS